MKGNDFLRKQEEEYMMDLYEAVFNRRSVRKYRDEKPVPEVLEKVAGIIGQAERLNRSINLQIHLITEKKKVDRILRGLVGNLGKIGAPCCLAITSEETEGYMENAGYSLENVVLGLTAMGLGTCWNGGRTDDSLLRELLGIDPGQRHLVNIPFGDLQEGDGLFRLDPAEAKRLDIKEIVQGQADDTWLGIMEAVRIAPSAANSQPWRFLVEGDRAHAYCKRPGNFLAKKLLGDINRLDMGIALCHAMVAARHASVALSVEKVEAPVYQDADYVASLIRI